MRFEKDGDFVEITDAVSANANCEVWFIETNLNFENLPVEFRKQVPKTDKNGFEKLKNAVVNWAKNSGFELKSDHEND